MSDLLVTVYPPLAPSTALRRRPRAFPFDQPGLTLTHLGRGAVWLALRALGLGAGRRIAMPAYHCGSEVETARLAGLDVDFYRVDASLRVDEEDLARAARAADAVYLISQFGFPMPTPPPGKCLIEDVAHGLFSDGLDGPLGCRADAAIFCPRKSLGVPDGGALLVRGRPGPTAQGRPGRTIQDRPSGKAMLRSLASLAVARAALARSRLLRRGASALLARASRSDAAAREGSLTETVIGEWDLERADMEAAAARPTRLTALLIRGADAGEIRARRRRNYETLLAEFGEHAPLPFRSLPTGVAPLYFPILAPDRGAAIVRMLDHGVRALEVWPVPHPLLDRERFAELVPLRRGLLALPVHQQLELRHMAAVVRATKVALKR